MLILLPIFVSVNGQFTYPTLSFWKHSSATSCSKETTVSLFYLASLVSTFSIAFPSTVGEALLLFLWWNRFSGRVSFFVFFFFSSLWNFPIFHPCTQGPSPVRTQHEFQPWPSSHNLVLQTLIHSNLCGNYFLISKEGWGGWGSKHVMSPDASSVGKESPAMQETAVWFLGQEDALEKG